MISISIDLTQIKESGKVTKSEKNGHSYINLIVDTRREVDNYGNTHTVYCSQSKEEREAKEAKKYVGNGKEFVFNQQQTTPVPNTTQQQPTPPDGEEDDDQLPF